MVFVRGKGRFVCDGERAFWVERIMLRERRALRWLDGGWRGGWLCCSRGRRLGDGSLAVRQGVEFYEWESQRVRV